MSTLEYTISLLGTMSEDKLREVQKYIQYLIFKDMGDMPMEFLSEEAIVRQLTESMGKSDMGVYCLPFRPRLLKALAQG